MKNAEISHVLTDNGLEFINRLIKSKKGNLFEKPSKLYMICKENNIEHRLTKPKTAKTNGMVKRENGIIKNGTVLKKIYLNKNEMNSALIAFLVHYILSTICYIEGMVGLEGSSRLKYLCRQLKNACPVA